MAHITNTGMEITLGDGSTTLVSEGVYELLSTLSNAVKFNPYLPKIFLLAEGIKSAPPELLAFYSFVISNYKYSHSQIFQDLFVANFFKEKRNGKFLEFGACDGKIFSNSFLLESRYQWSGVLAEPCPGWHQELRKNRPNARIITDCIYKDTGSKLTFFHSDTEELSTIEQYIDADALSIPLNASARKKGGQIAEVTSISLNDVFINYFDSKPIDYMSVDTEGSELSILMEFDFDKFHPTVVTVEHNYTDDEARLDTLFYNHGYTRFLREHTGFDAWYYRDDS